MSNWIISSVLTHLILCLNISTIGAQLPGNTTGDFLLVGDIVRGTIHIIDIETEAVNVLPISAKYTAGLRYDTKENTVYWSSSTNIQSDAPSNLTRMNIDGTDETTLYTAPHRIPGIAIDSIGRLVFFTDGKTGFYCMNIGTGEVTPISNIDYGYYIELDVIDKKIYWTTHINQGGSDHGIHSANYDGCQITQIKQIVSSLTYFINGLAIDINDKLLYWTGNGEDGNRIEKSKTDGSVREEIYRANATSDILSLAQIRRNTLVFTTQYDTSIRTMSTTGELGSTFGEPISYHMDQIHRVYRQDCGIVASIPNGNIQAVNPAYTKYGALANVTCNTGYNTTKQQIHCLENGSWETALCKINECSTIPDITKGKAVFLTNTTYGAKADVICDKGFTTNTPQITCSEDGLWTTSTCEAKVPNKSCHVDELHKYTWNYTRGGVQVNQSCPNTHKGQVTRECQVSGIWKPPYYNCTLKSLEDIKANLTQGNINPSKAMINLVNQLQVNVNGSDKTNTTLYIGDLIIIMEILELVTYNISNTSVQETEDFLTIASVVVDHEKNGDEWRSRVENVGKGAEEFLSVVDKFIAKATESFQNNNQPSLNITRQNLVLQYAKIEPSNPSSIVFPTALENDPKWNTTATSSVFLNYTAFYDQEVTAYSVVLYRNLSQSIPSTLSERPNKKDISVNSQVLSIQMLPKAPYPLNPNIEFTFRGFKNMDKAENHCSFWKLSETSNSSYFGTWSTDGCREIFSNSTHVQCACSHLTNFALLISPFVPPEEHVRILGVISIVGISISMAALLITIGIHALHWRLVKSDNSIMLVSLCIVLLVGNALFLGVVNRTDNAVGCKIIAAVLHYLFLVAFFLMLSEGVKIFIKIVFIFNKTSYLVHMLAVSFVVPLIIVGISLGVTKLEGYGGDKFCWLSRKNGVFWAFAGPSGLVILMNFIVIGLLTKTMCRRRPGVDKSIIQKAKLTAIKLMVIVPVLGVSWISGILSVDEDSLWLQYVFCIFNSLQGVAILIFHVIRNTQLHQVIQAQRARKKYLEDFTSSSKCSNCHIELKKKIMARLGIKQSSSTTVLASNTSAINLTDDKKSPSFNQKSTPERTTDIDNNKMDDLNLKDDYNSGYSTIRDASELKTHTGFTSTEKLFDNINDVEVKPNTKKYNIDKTKSETEYETPYSLDDKITVYDNDIPNDEQ